MQIIIIKLKKVIFFNQKLELLKINLVLLKIIQYLVWVILVVYYSTE